MERYKITGKIVLGFLTINDQYDCLLSEGILERENGTIWYIDTKGKRSESITTSNIVEVGLRNGDLEKIKNK